MDASHTSLLGHNTLRNTHEVNCNVWDFTLLCACISCGHTHKMFYPCVRSEMAFFSQKIHMHPNTHIPILTQGEVHRSILGVRYSVRAPVSNQVPSGAYKANGDYVCARTQYITLFSRIHLQCSHQRIHETWTRNRIHAPKSHPSPQDIHSRIPTPTTHHSHTSHTKVTLLSNFHYILPKPRPMTAIRIDRAKNLPNMDWGMQSDKSDAFVMVSLHDGETMEQLAGQIPTQPHPYTCCCIGDYLQFNPDHRHRNHADSNHRGRPGPNVEPNPLLPGAD